MVGILSAELQEVGLDSLQVVSFFPVLQGPPSPLLLLSLAVEFELVELGSATCLVGRLLSSNLFGVERVHVIVVEVTLGFQALLLSLLLDLLAQGIGIDTWKYVSSAFIHDRGVVPSR